jgi:4-hydroxy-3-methylbut-2-enyl diphosphate reductase
MAVVEIDPHSGFCTGVVKAIRKAEQFLKTGRSLYSLGDIVHNQMEVKRLEEKGLKPVSLEELNNMEQVDVLFRAHGEPPSSYQLAKEHSFRLIDATCPVVLHLQRQIRKTYENSKGTGLQLVIFGKPTHAEVIGLAGQTENTAIVIEREEELDRLDFGKPIVLFSQTTQSTEAFQQLIERISRRMQPGVSFSIWILFAGRWRIDCLICHHFVPVMMWCCLLAARTARMGKLCLKLA